MSAQPAAAGPPRDRAPAAVHAAAGAVAACRGGCSGAGLLVGYQSAGSQSLYDTPEKLARLRETHGRQRRRGRDERPHRAAGDRSAARSSSRSSRSLAIVVALMNMFLVGRHTRADEETGPGRADPLGPGRPPRPAGRRPAPGRAGQPRGRAGGVRRGRRDRAAGRRFGAARRWRSPASGSPSPRLTAVAAQVFENHRAVYGAVGAVLGAAFVLRAAGDAGDGTLSWLSPIGWGQRTFPYAGDRWWPLLLPLAATGAARRGRGRLAGPARLRRRACSRPGRAAPARHRRWAPRSGWPGACSAAR